jgi:hypothetical protein
MILRKNSSSTYDILVARYHEAEPNTGREIKWISLLWVLATDPEARVRFPALPEKKVVGLERGPLSLVSTTEKLLDRKVAAPV